MSQLNEEIILSILKKVIDPEIPINIVDLGLIYGIHLEEPLRIQMTLTQKGCPMHNEIKTMMRDALKDEDIEDVEIETIWDPPWSKDMVSTEWQKKLGWRS